MLYREELFVMKKYKHFKGEVYELICIAKHSETKEELVIYQNGKQEKFARPSTMFFEDVEYQGKLVPRFTEIS